MQRDLALLSGLTPACRVYSWVSFWVTLGKFQSAERDLVDLTRVPWIQRPTGGKAVLHGNDWTVAIALPLQSLASDEWPVDRLARAVRQVYRLSVPPLITALNLCGVPATLAENAGHTGAPRVADCFAHVSPNDIVDAQTGAKICGCALKLTPEAVLLQASIPIGPPLKPASQVLKGAEDVVVPTWNHQAFPEAIEAASMRFFSSSG